jgi:hypothetical protein
VNVKDGLTWAAVAVQGVAALLWLGSTVVRVSAARVLAEHKKIYGPHSGPMQITGEDGSDILATIERQSRWNRWAALTTGVGIGLQAVATAL